MNLSNYQTTDPNLLVGLINTELRNQAEDLDDLCKTHNLSEDLLVQRLAQAGYEYRAEQKQFR